jgi:regulator of sirC expression with transglutaminase-like and TPR domain
MLPPFEELAASGDATLDLLALALAAAFRPVDADAALATLDSLGAEVTDASSLVQVLAGVHGFTGDTQHYDDPDNSMLDRVLERHRGLPILLSVVYIETARRADLQLSGVGLPGHYVVGFFDGPEPLLLDPFNGGQRITVDAPATLVRPWSPHETTMRMLNNLVPAFQRRGNLSHALRAAELRLALPADPAEHDRVQAELTRLRAQLN